MPKTIVKRRLVNGNSVPIKLRRTQNGKGFTELKQKTIRGIKRWMPVTVPLATTAGLALATGAFVKETNRQRHARNRAGRNIEFEIDPRDTEKMSRELTENLRKQKARFGLGFQKPKIESKETIRKKKLKKINKVLKGGRINVL